MTSPDSEARRATGSWSLVDATGATTGGQGPFVITDDGLSAGEHTVSFLDADEFSALDWSIHLGLYPAGRLTLSMLGRRYDTFAAALREARLARRVSGMLAHGIDAPVRFRGATIDLEPAPADFFVFPTHLTVAPDRGDPWQLPLGAICSVRHSGKDWSIDVEAWGKLFRFGQLARLTEKFAASLSGAVARSRAELGAAEESPLFADGVGVPASRLPEFARLLERWSSPERLDGAKAIVARASDARLGLVKLVDADDQLLAARDALPDSVAAFVLAPIGSHVILEVVSGPSAATWVFEGDIDAINRDLQILHYRRRPLILSDEELASPSSDYRLAGRRLEPLRHLRAAKRDRISHDAAWAAKVSRAFG